MIDNPYQPPPTLPDDFTFRLPPNRPRGILTLAVLHVLGGLLMFGLCAFLATQFDEDDKSSIISWAIVVLGPLLGVLSFAIAAGLWFGHKWAWWLATFYYFQFAFGGVFVLLTIAFAYFVLNRPWNERSLELSMKQLSRVVVFLPLTWYMTNRRVVEHFGLGQLTRIRALGILTAFIVLLGGLVGLLFFIVLSLGGRLG